MNGDVAQLADAVICVIGTPVDEHLNPRTHAFYRVISELRPHLHDGQTLILRSTIFPGLSPRIDSMFRDFGPDVHVSFCPERVAQGHSLREIREIPQIISAFDEPGRHVARTIFGRIATQLIEVQPLEAELAKLFCNCYRYVTFAIAKSVLDDRAGCWRRLHAGPPRGDVPEPTHRYHAICWSGSWTVSVEGQDCSWLHSATIDSFLAAMLINEGLPQFIVNALKQRVNLRNRCVGILGMTFKADCDDPRDSLAFKLRHLLLLEAREVIMHDPYLSGPGYYALEDVVRRASVLVVGAPHASYRSLRIPPERIDEDIWYCLDRVESSAVLAQPHAIALSLQ